MMITSFIPPDNVDLLHELIKTSFDKIATWKSSSGDDILHYVCLYNAFKSCSVLAVFKSHFSLQEALVTACRNEAVECVKVLIDLGAHATSSDLDTAIYYYVTDIEIGRDSSRMEQIVKLIIESGTCYTPPMRFPTIFLDYQRQLAARQLALRATQRALKHAGVHKDLIPMMVARLKRHWVVI
jgi:hypothetical protein